MLFRFPCEFAMSLSLFDPAPGFDQPIAVLKHCHDKIRQQLATLQKLPAHLAAHGADQQAHDAAKSVLGYFTRSAPLHHADEEDDLLPALRACAHGGDATDLAQTEARILAEHRQMEALWRRLEPQLHAIMQGSALLSAGDAAQFAQLYTEHMTLEESRIAPMALRLLSPAQLAGLGHAMQKRRGIIEDPTPPDVRVEPPSLADMRTDYKRATLSETDVKEDPLAQFADWFEQALRAAVREPNAMTLATVGDDGRPSARIVLIKDYDARGFTWYTNYDSRKGEELAARPYASLLFFWSELERQVRIEGRVERVEPAESDAYFAKRPLPSRLSAIASEQSRPVASRADMERRYAEVSAQQGDDPARPAHWGGYRLVPDRLEFWQGRSSRFHDRIVYTRQADGSWQRGRLQP
jgi:pyridoxamine 5'-phosphate oxidase